LAVLLAGGLFLALLLQKHQQPREGTPQQADPPQRERIRRFWGVYRQAGQVRREGNLEQAAALYQQALALRPDHEDSLYYLGNILCELGRYREAIEAYRRLIAVNPQGSSRGYMRLGLVHACFEPGAPLDLPQAEHFFQRALETDPDSGALLNLGELALLRQEWKKAHRRLSEFNTDNAMHPAAPYLLGYLAWREGKREEAWTWFQRTLQRLQPKAPPVQWSEEGTFKADPELRWKALAQQSIFGSHWLRLRRYLNRNPLHRSVMESEYRRFQQFLDSLGQTRDDSGRKVQGE